mmetsp:Transcript_22898/g.34712  ORF Transcript_22898/g.34712 Transcript_22898/m.34712 type:complete len:275 (+) Transcript_22898:443-1267(+)
MDRHTQDQSLIIASDGSVANSFGTYGWIISTQSGVRIAKSSGNVYGHRASSYRAELSGLQACLHIIYHMQTYFKSSTHIQAEIHIDNLSVVDLCTHIQENLNHGQEAGDPLEIEFPGQIEDFRDELDLQHHYTMEPDWDLIINIRSILSIPHFNSLKFYWIKAHQDDKNPYDRLSLPAQLNVDADALCSRIQQQPKDEKYQRVPLTNYCHAHLDIKDQTVTSNYKGRIRRERATQPLYNYIASRNDWNEQQMKTIDWKLHKHALQFKHAKQKHY